MAGIAGVLPLGRPGTGPEPSAGGDPPLVDERTGAKIWFAGRIDNRSELLSFLETSGGLSDAALALAALRRWREDAPSRILGDFALACWDPESRSLLCARDRIGVKPFYYARTPDRFLFASEPAALFLDGSFPRRPNLSQVGRFLLNDRSEAVETLYEGVRSLPPAHRLQVGSGGERPVRYWDIDPARRIEYGSDEEYDEHFRTLFEEAVETRLRTGGGAAALLSGGLDSSAIVAMAARIGSRRPLPAKGFECWSMLFEGYDCDERDSIEAVVSGTGFPSHLHEYANLVGEAGLESCLEDPDIHYSPLNQALRPMLARAGRGGARVLLSGVGGDEFLAPGFHHLADLLRAGRWIDLVRQARWDARLFHAGIGSLLWHDALRPMTPRPLRRVYRAFRRRGRSVPDWIDRRFLARHPVHHSPERIFGAERFRSLEQEALVDGLRRNSNLTVGIVESGLLASRYGIDLRFPFLDSRLVEFLLAVPGEQRWWMDRPKRLLRRSLAGILPEKVRTRRDKVEFSSVLAAEMEGRMFRTVEALLRSPALEEAGIVTGPAIRRRFAEYLAGKNRSGNYWVLYNFIGMEIWFRAVTGGALPREASRAIHRVA